MGRATQKQIDYAYAIADYLEIERPDVTFEECQNFISENIEIYKKKRKDITHELIDIGHPYYKEYVETLGEITVSWVEENLHHVPGVYAFLGKRNKALYIGKSIDLAGRIPSSFTERRTKADIRRIMYYVTPTKSDASVLKMLLITENKPKLNTDGLFNDTPQMYQSGIDIKKDFKEIPLKKGS